MYRQNNQNNSRKVASRQQIPGQQETGGPIFLREATRGHKTSAGTHCYTKVSTGIMGLEPIAIPSIS